MFRELTAEDFEKMWDGHYERVFAEQAAYLLDISVPKLRRLVSEGKIPAEKVGKKLVFYKKSLIDFQMEIANSKIRECNKKYGNE